MPTPTPAIAPALTSEQRLFAGKGPKHKVAGFQLNFSGPLDQGAAESTGSYQVVQPGRGKKAHSKAVSVLAASYNAGNNSVTLTLGKFNAALPLTLTATGLMGATGTPAGTISSRL
jgi:hypothetical protein